MAGTGKRDTMPTKQKVTKCMVVGDSILRNVGAEHVDMMVECFPGIRTEQPHRVIEKRELGSPETVINEKFRLRNGRSICVGVYGKKETSELQTCPEWSVAT
jgi:hypothetical protein